VRITLRIGGFVLLVLALFLLGIFQPLRGEKVWKDRLSFAIDREIYTGSSSRDYLPDIFVKGVVADQTFGNGHFEIRSEPLHAMEGGGYYTGQPKVSGFNLPLHP
jgi:hypothetical protein